MPKNHKHPKSVTTDEQARSMAKDPGFAEMEDRIVKALIRTRNYLASGVTEQEFRDIGGWKGCEDMASDCYLEMYGDDKGAAAFFDQLTEPERKRLIDRAFNRGK